MKGTITIAGNIILDNLKYIDTYPPMLQLTAITRLDKSSGGAVCNVGLALAHLDPELPLRAVGWIGNDDAGDYLLSQFAKHPSMDVSHIRRSGITSFTDVMTVSATGERTFFTHKGADNLLTPEDFPQDSNTAILHVGYALLLDKLDAPDETYGTQMARALAEAKARGALTSVDVVSESSERYRTVIPHALRQADYITINEHEASRITGITLREGDTLHADRLPEVCRALREMGAHRWVVIHMPEVACGLDENGNYVQVSALKLPKGYIINSTGAGDAFAAGILYSIYNEYSLEDALRMANATAACSLSGAYATDGIPHAKEAIKLYNTMEVQK